jgi:hypothetical protein
MMIKQYLFILLFSYIEYFIFLFFLEYKENFTWENIKF